VANDKVKLPPPTKTRCAKQNLYPGVSFNLLFGELTFALIAGLQPL